MPFQQLGFSPYPTGPRRDTSAYKGMGQGLSQAGQGVSDMMGAFQNMKERRQKNLMALTAEERKQQAFVMDKEKYEALKSKTEKESLEEQKWQDYNLKILESEEKKEEILNNRMEAQLERENKIEIERMKAQQSLQTPTSIGGTAGAPQTPSMPQTPTQPQTPLSPGGYQEPAPLPGISPGQQQTMDFARPSQADYIHKATSLGRRLDPQLMSHLYPKAGKVPLTMDERKELETHKQNVKRFAPKSGGKANIDNNPEYIMTSLEDTYQNLDQIHKEIELNSKDFWKTPRLDITGAQIPGEFNENQPARQRFLAGKQKDFRRAKKALPKLRALYKKKFGKAYVPPKVREKLQDFADKKGIKFDEALNMYLLKKGALSAN